MPAGGTNIDECIMIGNFVIATLMVGFTVATHFGGLLCLMWLLRNRGIASAPMRAPPAKVP